MANSSVQNRIFPSAKVFEEILTEDISSLRDQAASLKVQWASLSRERNPDLFYRGLLRLGKQLEEGGGSAEAFRLYQKVREEKGLSADLVHEVQKRLSALQGEGSFGTKFEKGMSKFIDGIISPGMLVGMGVGGLGYGVGKLAGTEALLAWGARGSLLKFSSRGAGILTEAAGFVVGKRSAERLVGEKVVGETVNFWQEYRSALALFGCLRVAGFGAKALHRLWRGPAAAGGFSEGVAQQVGNYVGILGGNYLSGETKNQPLGDQLVDGLISLATFHVAGKIQRKLFGRWLRPLERDLQTRIGELESMEQGSVGGWEKLSGGLVEAVGTIGRGVEKISYGKIFSNQVFSQSDSEGGGKFGDSKGKTPPAPGSSYRKPMPTLTFIESSEGNVEGDPRQVESTVELFDRIQREDRYHFVEKLLGEGIVRFNHTGTFDTENSSPRLKRLLDLVTEVHRNPEGQERQLRLGSKVILTLDAHSTRPFPQEIEFILKKDGFSFNDPKLVPARPEEPTSQNEVPIEDRETPKTPFPPFPERKTPLPDSQRERRAHSGLFHSETPTQLRPMEGFAQFVRRLSENGEQDRFIEQLKESHLVMTFRHKFAFSLGSLAEILNNFQKINEIPDGRRINLVVGSQKTQHVLIKINGQFISPLEPLEPSPTLRSPEKREADSSSEKREPTSTAAMMEMAFDKPDSLEIPDSSPDPEVEGAQKVRRSARRTPEWFKEAIEGGEPQKTPETISGPASSETWKARTFKTLLQKLKLVIKPTLDTECVNILYEGKQGLEETYLNNIRILLARLPAGRVVNLLERSTQRRYRFEKVGEEIQMEEKKPDSSNKP